MTEKIEDKRIRIIWDTNENIPVLYANHLYVSNAGDTEFNLVFGHLSPPLTMGLDESELPDTVKIRPVANIVVSPDAMKAFVRLLSDNLAAFEDRLKGKSNE